MPATEMLVSLKIPDNVAISALGVLHRMGHEVKSLERHDYYRFEFSGDKNSFERKISHVDILVNANKHKFSFSMPKNDGKVMVLVQNLEGDMGLLRTLRDSLGFKGLKRAEKGTLWVMGLGNDDMEIASEIAKGLLMNENYQKFRVIGE